MVNPYNKDLKTEEKISRNEMLLKALSKNARKPVCSFAYTFMKEPIMPTNAEYNISTGCINVEAIIRVTTKNLKGLVAETSIASICSVTRIEPNSAPILEPTFPAVIKAVTNGANARTTAMEIREGSQELAPNVESEGRDCLVKTIPVIKPVSDIKISER